MLPWCSGTVYEIYKVVSPPRVVRCDVDMRNTHFEFAQPVAIERLVGYMMADLEVPLELDAPLVLEIKKGAADVFRRGATKSQSATGLVLVATENGEEEWIDLGQVEHRWVNAGPGAAAALEAPPVA